jgi:hypothetical protein
MLDPAGRVVKQRAVCAAAFGPALVLVARGFPTDSEATITDRPGLDPIIGQTGGTNTHGIKAIDPTRLQKPPPFVPALGGECFFSPSISAPANTIAKA